jgi:hypothetical protein
MFDEFNQEPESNSMFESFSDMALCTLAVTLLMIALLAINITQRYSVTFNKNHYSGGSKRPVMYFECTRPNFAATSTDALKLERALFADQPYVMVHLFSPSLALAQTEVKEGGTVAGEESQTFERQHDLTLKKFLMLASGIEPGSFEVNGSATSLLIPSIVNKQIVYEPQLANGYRANSDLNLAEKVIAAAWPVFQNRSYPVRRPEEFRNSRAKIYVESQLVDGQHYLIIGHASYKLPEALEDGSLSWLSSFASGLTEVIYLGDAWSDADNQTNKRIAFFEANGFDDCAKAYRAFSYDPVWNGDHERMMTKAKQATGRSEAALKSLVSEAVAQQKLSAALSTGIDASMLPPLLAYPDAWKAYVQQNVETADEPPEWFYNEFLAPLGFDRLSFEQPGK